MAATELFQGVKKKCTWLILISCWPKCIRCINVQKLHHYAIMQSF